MGYGSNVRLPFLERIVYIEVEIGSHRYNNIIRFRRRFERIAVIDVFIVHCPIYTGLRFNGKYAYGITRLKAALLGVSCLRIPGDGGKCDKPAAGGFLLCGIVPAG